MFSIFQKYEKAVTTATTTGDNTTLIASTAELQQVYGYFCIMILQSAIYLLACILIDVYWARFQSFVLSIRWFYSIHNYCAVNSSYTALRRPHTNATHDTEHTSLLSGEKNPIDYSSANQSEHHDLNRRDGNRVAQHIQMIGGVGLFPIVDPNTYIHAMQQEKERLQRAPNEDVMDAQSDIEMVSLGTVTNISHSSLLKAEGLCVEYAHKGRLSLCDVSFDFGNSERIALMGMNGGGKSTLFKTLANAECVPIAGRVSIAG
jgi:ABC-type multidrug transport system fused ATPase/permease subunit